MSNSSMILSAILFMMLTMPCSASGDSLPRLCLDAIGSEDCTSFNCSNGEQSYDMYAKCLEERMEDHLRAEMYFRRAMIMSRGSILLEEHLHKIIADLSKAIELGKKTAIIFEKRGWHYNRLEEHELAKADYDQAISLFSSEFAEILFSRLMINRGNNNHLAVIEDATTIIGLLSGSGHYLLLDTYYTRAAAYRATGAIDQAREDEIIIEEIEAENYNPEGNG